MRKFLFIIIFTENRFCCSSVNLFILLWVFFNIIISVSTSQSFSSLTMDNNCPYCAKSCPNKYALKRHADSCEIKSSSAPVRKSSRKSNHLEAVLLTKDSDLEKVLPSSCPFIQ